jgi:hypothetical protein
MIIGVLVSSFDHATNNVHLAEISYPNVLHGLLDVARDSNIEELISWATILVKCVQYDGHCRRYISRLAPMAPFSRLLESNMKHARCIALEFFHEVLCIPRYVNMLQIFNILNWFYDDNASHLKLRTKLKNAWFLSNCDTAPSSNVISMVDEIYIGIP